MTGWFLLTNALLCGGIGAALWGVVSLVALKGISWLIIFAGYAIVFPGFLGGFPHTIPLFQLLER